MHNPILRHITQDHITQAYLALIGKAMPGSLAMLSTSQLETLVQMASEEIAARERITSALMDAIGDGD